MTLERAALLAMSLGLLCIIQPWAHALFAVGFAVVLAGVIAYNVAAFLARGEAEDG